MMDTANDPVATLRGPLQPQQSISIDQIYQQPRSLQEDEGPSSLGTYFTITGSNDDTSPTTPSRIEIEIVNPKPSEDYWYSVTIVSQNRYTGSAMNMGEMDMGRSTKSLMYYWKPLFNGEYQVIVHELQTLVTGIEPTDPIADPFPITIKNKPGVKSWGLVQERLTTLPPCQNVRKPGLYTTWEGDWIGPEIFTSEGTLRTGWYFLPGNYMNCKIEMYTDAELSVIPDMKSIYVIGTSKERGVFLSLVDMLLNTREKEYLGESVISKCWGRAHVVKNNLKVLYQDWRSNYFEPENAQPNVLCHDDKVVREGGSLLFNNGLKVFEEIFQDPSAWPSVILMSTGGNIGFRGDYNLEKFFTSLPHAWEGTLFLTDGTFSAMHAGRGSHQDYIEYRQKLKDLTNNMFDRRVQWLDGIGISRDMRMYSEDGPDHVTRSQHFHGSCDEVYTSGGQEKRMRICSNITEMVAQLLINYALGPKQRFIEKVEHLGVKSDDDAEMVYCHACPKDLLPFHITPYPQMTCEVGVLHARTKTEASTSGPETCPAGCLELEITKYVPTQSGYAHERLCPMDIFLPASTRIAETVDIEADVDLNAHSPFYISCILFSIVLYVQARRKLKWRPGILSGFTQDRLVKRRSFDVLSNENDF